MSGGGYDEDGIYWANPIEGPSRDEIQRLKQWSSHLESRVKALDVPTVKEVVRERNGSPALMRKYGMDPQNPEHRKAWRDRNNTDCGGTW